MVNLALVTELMPQLANLAIMLNLRLFALLKQVRLAANLSKP